MTLSPSYLACAALRNRSVLNAALHGCRAVLGTGHDGLPSGELRSIGSPRRAREIARRAERGVPAYQDFRRGTPGERPVTDKAAYIQRFPISQLLAEEWQNTFAIFRSSGSSGQARYWPQLKSTHRLSKWAVWFQLEHCFKIQQRRSIAIVGLSLGSWIGGDYISSLLKSIAIDAPYPFCVFTPGNRHDEIVGMISQVQGYVDQIILFLCPSAIGHLTLLAEQKGLNLPLDKLRYVVLAEPFPEQLRLSLSEGAGLAAGQSPIFSIYGSTDTGTLGVESPASVAVRQILTHNPELAADLGFGEPIPHLFHFSAPDAYLENVAGELLVTRWQGIPLVRYNLHDAVRFFSWPALRKRVLASKALRDSDAALVDVLRRASAALPSILAISGRTDRCLILCGTNLSEAMLDAAIRSDSLESVLTGAFEARIEHSAGRQRLGLKLELKPGVSRSAALDRHVYRSLIDALGRVQPEFFDDWQNIYRRWDDDSSLRVLRLEYHEWPALSRTLETQVKRTGVNQ